MCVLHRSALCLTLCSLMGCSLLGLSSVYGIFQERILEWVAISFSRGSFLSRDRTQVSGIEGRYFTIEPPGKHLLLENCKLKQQLYIYTSTEQTCK